MKNLPLMQKLCLKVYKIKHLKKGTRLEVEYNSLHLG